MWNSKLKLNLLYRATFIPASMGENGIRRFGTEPDDIDSATLTEIESRVGMNLPIVNIWPYLLQSFTRFHDDFYHPRIRKQENGKYMTTVSWFYRIFRNSRSDESRYDVTILSLTSDELKYIKENRVTHIGFELSGYPNGSGLNVAIIIEPETLYNEIGQLLE
jgi:hypothetical protein